MWLNVLFPVFDRLFIVNPGRRAKIVEHEISSFTSSMPYTIHHTHISEWYFFIHYELRATTVEFDASATRIWTFFFSPFDSFASSSYDPLFGIHTIQTLNERRNNKDHDAREPKHLRSRRLVNERDAKTKNNNERMICATEQIIWFDLPISNIQ